MWEAVLIPVFDRDVKTIPPMNDDIGVYRYLFDNQVVYIGQGNIKQRLASLERRDWVFDKIEYFLTQDGAEAITLEALYLEDFKKEYKRLPMFNKISGLS
jgi:excinuclease UvrABC nuclease subunit